MVYDKLSAIEAERSVVGAIMLNDDALDWVTSAGLQADDFGDDSLRAIFSTMLDLSGQRVKIDALTLSAELERIGKLDAVGGRGELIDIFEGVPAVANAAHYANIIMERALSRRVLDAVRDAESKLVEGARPKDVSEGLLAGLEKVPNQGIEMGSLRDFLKDDVGLKSVQAFEWGWPSLDKYTGGIPEGALTTIGAYPGVGKTTMAVSVLMHLAKQGIPVAIFSAEMSAAQLIQTIIARESLVSVQKIRKSGVYGLDDTARQRVIDKAVSLAMLPLYLIPGPTSAREISSTARILQRRHGIKVVAVDYLQLLKRGADEESRRLGIDQALATLKALALTTGMSVLVMSQLARGQNHGGKSKPSSELLKESGGIKETSDLILVLDRPHFRESEECTFCAGGGNTMCPQCSGTGHIDKDTILSISVEKNKFGPAGHTYNLAWHGEHMRIAELAT